MAYPSLLPLDGPIIASQQIGTNFLRYIAADGGGYTRNTLVYTVPAGRKAIVSEIYSIVYQFIVAPSGLIFVDVTGAIFARISVSVSGSTVYGSVNYIQGFPITLKEGEKIYLELTGADLSQFIGMSVLLEEKDKNN